MLLALILGVSGSSIVLALRTTSTTFDEIVMIAAGARGYQGGDWHLAPEHPPFTQYLYGLLPYLAGPRLPDEAAAPAEWRQDRAYRYRYAQELFWGVGNDPERLALLGRFPAALCALLLSALVFGFARRHYGEAAGLVAATVCAFLPDVLAHGGVAYNDVPLAAAFLAALWLLDEVVRRPTVARALAAGAVTGLALGIKNSAVSLVPAACLLLLAEIAVRRHDPAWRKRLAVPLLLIPIAAYASLVLVYRGDLALAEYRYALAFVLGQVAGSRAPSYLLGRLSTDGIPYYFPVAFLFKTSAGLHLLLALSTSYLATRVRSLRQVVGSPLRVPLIGALVFGALLMRSQVNLGFRYALPVLPLLAIVVGAGAAALWSDPAWRRLRPAIALALLWLVVHPLTYYPHFLAYVSEYGPGRDRNYEVLADSSLDWGQGLLLLRDYMRERGIPRVYLSYFGSAWPAGYGIDYVPLESFARLPPPPRRPGNQARPTHAAVSATNLVGAYFGGRDPFAALRERQPEAVLGHTVFVYRVGP